MTDKQRFTLGYALLLSWLVFELLLPAAFSALRNFVFPPGSLLDAVANSGMVYRVVFSPLTGLFLRLAAIAGLLLLIGHHYSVPEEDRRAYRSLDRVLALFVLVLVVPGILVVALPFIPGAAPYIGLARLWVFGGHFLLVGCGLLWAWGLWRARAGMALLFSVACVVLIFGPHIPMNNPEILAEFESPSHQPHEVSKDADLTDLEAPPGAPAEWAATEDVPTNESTRVVQPRHRARLQGMWPPEMLLLLLLAYTWLRWGHVCTGAARLSEAVASDPTEHALPLDSGPDTGGAGLDRTEPARVVASQPADYAWGEAILLLFLPGYIALTLVMMEI